MPSSSLYGNNAVTEALIKQRRLSSRDANLARAVQMSDAERQGDVETDLQQSNVLELVREIENSTDPRVRALLMQELAKIKGHMSNLLGPIPQQNSTLPMRPLFRPTELPDTPEMTVPLGPLQPSPRGRF